VRPTGKPPPRFLNRLEIRILRFDQRPLVLLAVTASSSCGLLQLDSNPEAHDPLRASSLAHAELAEKLSDANDLAASQGQPGRTNLDWRQRRSPCRPAPGHLRRESLNPCKPAGDSNWALGPGLAPLPRCWTWP